MTAFDRFFAFMTKPVVIVSYFLLIVVSYLYFDQKIAQFFNAINIRNNFIFLTWITNAGLGGIYLCLFFIMIVYFRYIKPNPMWEVRSWFLWLCIVIPSVICTILKIAFSRARPDLLFTENDYGFHGFMLNSEYWSFPSGHTTTVMGVVFGLCVLCPRHLSSIILAGLVVVASRVLLYHHYLSDVLTASYLTLIEVGGILYLFRQQRWSLTPIQLNRAC